MPQTPGQIYDAKVQSGQCPEVPGSTEAYCKHLRTPVWLIGCVVSMLRQYFGSPDRIALERGTFLWDEGPQNSKVYISDDLNWDFENVGSRPALIVELANMNSIEEVPTIGRSGLTNYDPTEGTYNFSTIEQGVLLVRAIATQKLECWALTWEAKLFLQSYADALRDTYGFKTFRVGGVDAPVPLPEAKEYKVATIQIPFSMIDSWAIKRENLKVQSIDPSFTDLQNNPLFRSN